MSLTMGYQSLDVKQIGAHTTVPDNNLAKLMYYLSCVFTVIQFEDSYKYTNYSQYYLLSPEDEQTVLALAALFNPKIMIEASLFIIDPRFCPPGYSNEFYEITNDKIGLHINSEVMIGGVSRKVLKMMACKESWLNQNYFDPIESYRRPQLPAANNYSYNNNSNGNNCCCICDCLYLIFRLFTCLCLCDENWSISCKRTIIMVVLIIIIGIIVSSTQY